MKHKQFGFSFLFVLLAVAVLAAIGAATYTVVAHRPTKSTASQPADAWLPDISYWQTHKSDQFLVDMDTVQAGHTFMGTRSAAPHQGGHVHFGDDYKTWPRGGSAPSNYPPIYAVADGIISNVTYTLVVGDNQRYGIALEIAKNVAFEYSIEPFVKEPSPGFYKKFILVSASQRVKKGQIIAYMYLPHIDTGTHIHFNLDTVNGTPHFTAPAIFTPDIVQAFRSRWDENSSVDRGKTIPACMGYMLAASENPFGTGASDCLN